MSKKQPKRSHRLLYGEGAFYYSTPLKRWVGSIEAGYSDSGARRRITVTDQDEDRAWQKFQAKRKQILIEGIPAQGIGSSVTVKTWCDNRLPRRKAELKPSPFQAESVAVRKWIIPTLGHRKLEALHPGDLRALGDRVLQENSATYAGKIQSIFKEYLRAARLEGYRVPDQILQAKKIAPSANARAQIPLDKTLRILKAARERGNDFSRWDAAFLQSIRQGEALGLLDEMIDFRNHRLKIWWELQELKKDPGSASGYHVPAQFEAQQIEGRFWLLQPKSKSSRRAIPMIPAFERSLAEWLECRPNSPYGLVWPRENGLPRIAAQDRREFCELQDLARAWKQPGDKPTYYVPHEARHTAISLLLELKVPREIIEAIAGHSKLVENYVHVDEAQIQSALEDLGGVLKLESQ